MCSCIVCGKEIRHVKGDVIPSLEDHYKAKHKAPKCKEGAE
jgi:hypothetical protein